MSSHTEDHDHRGIKAPQKIRDIQSPNLAIKSRLIHSITIAWGDCDPAQIAYTANIPGWGLLGIESWYKACLGTNWYELNLHYGIGTPFVSLNFNFKAPIRPLWALDINVFVVKIGNSSLSHYVEGYQNGALCCYGSTVAAFVDATKMNPISIPPNIRETINHYVSIQGQLPNRAT